MTEPAAEASTEAAPETDNAAEHAAENADKAAKPAAEVSHVNACSYLTRWTCQSSNLPLTPQADSAAPFKDDATTAKTKADIATTEDEVLTSPLSTLRVFGLLMSGALLHALLTLAVHAAATALKTLPNLVGFA